MASTAPLDRKNRRVALYAVLAALAMLGLGYASVPLYRIFCQVTGFGGTTQRATLAEAISAEQLAKSAGARTFSIRFDANTAPDVPWTFRPRQVTDTVQIGERDMAIFEAKNLSSVPVTGTASFNVEPEQAGPYFNKIQCFCFTSQTLQPGQEVSMPVLFYIDPKAKDDPNMDGVEQITLSYTFHRTK
jgi:cytochrome c oxidase assembly protein subunit 11